MKTSLKKGTIYLTISALIFMISGYVVNFWLGRSLGPTQYGVYGVLISLITAVNITQGNGLPQTISKFIAEDEEKAESILWSSLIIQIFSTIAVSILLFVSSGIIAGFLRDNSLVPYMQLSAAIFPLYGMYSLYLGYYNGLHLFKKQAFINVIYAIGKCVFIISLVHIWGLYGAILGFILSSFIGLIAGIHIPQKINRAFPIKPLILFSIPLIGYAIVSTLQLSIDLFFLKSLYHSSQGIGYYTANQNITRIPLFGFSALSEVLLPAISKSIGQNLHSKIQLVTDQAIRFTFLLLTPTIILIAITSKQVLTLLFSSAYQLGASSLSILIFGTGLYTLYNIISNILSGAGKPNTPFGISIVGLIITSFFCYILIPFSGLIGAALATTIGSFISLLLGCFFLYRQINVSLPISSLAKISLSGSIILLLGIYIQVSLIFTPILYVILSLVYIGALYLLKEITHEDIVFIRSLIPAWISGKIPFL